MKRNIKIHYYEELESTNKALKEMAKNGAEEGTVIIAKKQTDGKGRLGRSFCSKEGGLYMSLLLKPQIPPEKALQITACAAVATAEAIESVTGTVCGIKWVNDLFLNGKKICGILTEGAIIPDRSMLDYAVLGIGVNVYPSKNGFPDELKSIAGAIYDEPQENDIIKKLAEEIIKRFFDYYDKGDTTYIEKYRRRSILIGKEVSYIKDSLSHSGKVLGIDENASLIIKENGKTVKLSAGEVSVKLN